MEDHRKLDEISDRLARLETHVTEGRRANDERWQRHEEEHRELRETLTTFVKTNGQNHRLATATVAGGSAALPVGLLIVAKLLGWF